MAVYLRDIASMQSYQMNSACFREMSFNQDPELELLVYQRQYHALHQRLRGTTVAPSNNASDDNAESTASSRRKDPNYLTITVKMAIFIGGGFTKEWMTCLEYAAWKGDWKLACVLVANGADPQYNSFTGFRASTTNIQDTRRRRYKPVGPPPFVSLNGTTTIPGFAGLRAVVEDDLKNREQMLAFLWLLERCCGSSVPAPDNVRRVKELASSSSRTTPLKTVLSTPQQQPDANTVRQDFAKIVSCLQLVCLEHQDPEPGRNCDDSSNHKIINKNSCGVVNRLKDVIRTTAAVCLHYGIDTHVTLQILETVILTFLWDWLTVEMIAENSEVGPSY